MESLPLFVTLFLIGISGAFVSGMLGLGGAIILVPMLLYLPPLVGAGALDMKQVSGITIIVVFASSLSSLFVHNKNRLVVRDLVILMGLTAVVSGFLGAVYSKYVTGKVLLSIFAVMSAFAAVILFIPKKEAEGDVRPEDIKFNKTGAVIIALTVGFIGGMVGAPGAYIFTPLMMYFLKIPTKAAIGSTMGIVFIASIAGASGKLITAQVPYLMTAAVVLGAVPAARIGARFTQKVPAATLKKALAYIIAFASLRMLYDVFKG
jgi:hypothetical protein